MIKNIQFRSNKGYPLKGILHIPKGKGPFPTVIVQHGFKGNYNDFIIRVIARRLEKQGYIVLRFALSGHKPSQGDYKDILVSRFVKDVGQAIKFLKKQPKVNVNRIGIVGHSMGGFTALAAAVKYHQDIRTVVSVSSFYDTKALVKTYYRDKMVNEDHKDYWLIGGFKITKKHFNDRVYMAEHYEFSQIHCPTLIIHGTGDKRVQPKDAITIYKLLAGPKKLEWIKGANHVYINFLHARRVANLTADWLHKYLAFKVSKVVNVFLECNGKILMLKRGDRVATHRNVWCPVGGYLDEERGPLFQAKKEVLEETGINPKLLTNHFMAKPFMAEEPSIDRVWKNHVFLFKLKKQPKVKLDWENIDYKWVTPREALKLKAVPQLKKDLELLKLISARG